MSADLMPVVPGSEIAPPRNRTASGSAREPAQGDGTFADMVGRFVDAKAATPKAARPAPGGPQANARSQPQAAAAEASGPSPEAEFPRGPVAPPELGTVAFLLESMSSSREEESVPADATDVPAPEPGAPPPGTELPPAPIEVNVAVALVPMCVPATLALASTHVEGPSADPGPAAADPHASEAAGAPGVAAGAMTGVLGARPLTAQATTPLQGAPAPPGAGRAPDATTAAPGGVPEPGSTAAERRPGEPRVPEVQASEFSSAPGAGAEVQAGQEPVDGPVAPGPALAPRRATPRPDLPLQASPTAEAARSEGTPPVARGLNRTAPPAPPAATAVADVPTGRDGTEAVPASGNEAAAAPKAVDTAPAQASASVAKDATPVARGLNRAAPPPPPAATVVADAQKGRDGAEAVPASGNEAAASPMAVENAPAQARVSVVEGATPVARGLNRAAPPAAGLVADLSKGQYGTEPVPANGTETEAAASAAEPALVQAGLAEGRTTAAESRPLEPAARAAVSRWAVAQGIAPQERQATEAEVPRASAEALSPLASAMARVVAGAAPFRLETDVLSMKSPAAAFPQANALPSGLPFSLDLLAALRASDISAPSSPSALHRPADPGDVPSQIVRAAHLQWRDGVGEARLRLNPEHLGEVTITLRVEQGAVFATIRAESPAALYAIQARQQELQAALEAQGLHLDHFVASADPDERRDQSPYRPPRHPQALPSPESDVETPRFEVLA